MSKVKMLELVLLAVSALINAARLVVKFINYLGKLKQEREECAAFG